MSAYTNDQFRGKTAEQLRAEAAEADQRAEDSFQRCDTDGFLSQWASGMTAQLYRAQAKIVEAGGRAPFTGLYHGERRVAAKMVDTPAFNRPWATTAKWLLREDEEARFGRRWLPTGGRSRVQQQLGLREARELAPARAAIGGGGTGLSGCASAYVTTYRAGDEWGQDAVLVPPAG